MFTYGRWLELLDSADVPSPEFDLVQERNDAACRYLDAFVDRVPRNDVEARELFTLAAELAPEVEPVRTITGLHGRSTEALITLRRLAGEAGRQEDPSDPPQRHAERALHALIAWMSKPVLLSE